MNNMCVYQDWILADYKIEAAKIANVCATKGGGGSIPEESVGPHLDGLLLLLVLALLAELEVVFGRVLEFLVLVLRQALHQVLIHGIDEVQYLEVLLQQALQEGAVLQILLALTWTGNLSDIKHIQGGRPPDRSRAFHTLQ